MTKRLLLLGGLAIVTVVLNHAALYGQIALFLWANSYLPVSVPNLDALDSVSHYGLLAIRSIGLFTVPAFLFIAGFFSAYMDRAGSPTSHLWKAVLRRVQSLAIPYVFWSILIFGAKALQGTIYRPLEYVAKLLTTGASGYLYFVPVLCSCYLVSPWVVAFAKRRPRLLLSVSVLLQVVVLVSGYSRRFGIRNSILVWIGRVTPYWSLPWWILFFVLGSVTAFNINRVKELLTNYRWQIAAVAVALWLLNVTEGIVLLRAHRTEWFAGLDTLSGNLSALSALACFLAFSDVQIPWSKALHELSKRSYGIYLVHEPFINLTAHVIRKIAPWILGYQVMLVPTLFVAGLGIPLLAMAVVKRWLPSRRFYPYLFG